MSFVWLIVVILMIIAEASTAQLISVWFVIGAIFALITSIFTESIIIQMIVFSLVSVLMLLLARPVLKRLLMFKIEDTNLGRLIGKTATVIEDIDNECGTGQVNVGGKIWTARASNDVTIKSSSKVLIDSIDGVKLIVHKQ